MKIEFEVPQSFGIVEPLVDGETGRDALQARLGGAFREFSAEEAADLASALECMSRLYYASGTFYAANCRAEIAGDATIAMLNMAKNSVSFRDPFVAVEGIVESFSRGARTSHTDMLNMPCGPAAVKIRSYPGLRIPADLLQAEQDLPVELGELQAYVPVPPKKDTWGEELVVITCVTPSIRHWDTYCAMMADLLRSVRFVPDVERGESVNSSVVST